MSCLGLWIYARLYASHAQNVYAYIYMCVYAHVHTLLEYKVIQLSSICYFYLLAIQFCPSSLYLNFLVSPPQVYFVP